MAPDYYKLDGFQKMMITIVICICLLIAYAVERNIQETEGFIRSGLEKCSYVIPGRSEILSTWERTCRPIFSSEIPVTIQQPSTN